MNDDLTIGRLRLRIASLESQVEGLPSSEDVDAIAKRLRDLQSSITARASDAATAEVIAELQGDVIEIAAEVERQAAEIVALKKRPMTVVAAGGGGGSPGPQGPAGPPGPPGAGMHSYWPTGW